MDLSGKHSPQHTAPPLPSSSSLLQKNDAGNVTITLFDRNQDLSNCARMWWVGVGEPSGNSHFEEAWAVPVCLAVFLLLLHHCHPCDCLSDGESQLSSSSEFHKISSKARFIQQSFHLRQLSLKGLVLCNHVTPSCCQLPDDFLSQSSWLFYSSLHSVSQLTLIRYDTAPPNSYFLCKNYIINIPPDLETKSSRTTI